MKNIFEEEEMQWRENELLCLIHTIILLMLLELL